MANGLNIETIKPVLRIRILDLGSGAFLTRSFFPDPDPNHISESLVKIFGVKIFKFCVNWLKSFSVPDPEIE